jgi:hypothetical protein
VKRVITVTSRPDGDVFRAAVTAPVKNAKALTQTNVPGEMLVDRTCGLERLEDARGDATEHFSYAEHCVSR